MPPGKPSVAKNTAGNIAFMINTFANPARLHHAVLNWNALSKMRKNAVNIVLIAISNSN
jgi:hypothetical protein